MEYSIFTEGTEVRAVKQGWSWPGFFFGPFWALSKGMVGMFFLLILATLLLNIIVGFILGFWTDTPPVTVVIIYNFALPFWVGFKGNIMFENKLIKKKFELVGVLSASSPKDAISKFSQKGIPAT